MTKIFEQETKIHDITDGINIAGSSHAPFIYFEHAPTFGHQGGIVQITLEATRMYSASDSVLREKVAVAHLRMTQAAAESLKQAIDKAILLLSPVPQVTRN